MTREEAIYRLKNTACADSDLIRRSDAMGAVQDHFNADGFKGYDDGQQMMDRIKALPSAEARPTGEWIDIDNYYRMATCSHCLKVTMFEKWGEYTRPYNFCPNCGARMLGEDGEER